MIIIITLVYLVCVIVAFKVVKIRPSPASIATAALIGVLMLGGILVVWKRAAPTTGQMILRRHVVEVTPDVRETVSQVHVESNEFVEKGQPLFEIAPERFQNAVDQSTADLAAAFV